MVNLEENILKRVNQVFELYQKFGDEDYIGEPVSQLAHMSQAAEFAIENGYDDEVILASFFHDIGHLVDSNDQEKMGDFGVVSHETLGANYLLSLGFSERIAKLVKGHVDAKRYLTFKFQEYYDKLSEASKKTLVYQGGIMNQAEALDFEKDPDKKLMILMRTWDDESKVENKNGIDLEMIKQKAILHLQKRF